MTRPSAEQIAQVVARVTAYRGLRFAGLGAGAVGAALSWLAGSRLPADVGLAVMLILIAAGTGLLSTIRCPVCLRPMIMVIHAIAERKLRYRYDTCAHCGFRTRV